MRRIVLPLVFVVLFSASLNAQVASSSGQVVRDQDALMTLQAAITALGGATAIGQTQTWKAQGQLQSVAPDATAVNGTITWETDGTEILLASSTNKGPGAFLTGHGNPAMVSNTKVLQLPSYVVTSMFIPALAASILLKDFQNSTCQLRYRGQKNLGLESVTVVNIVTTGVPNFEETAQTWYFDSSTNLPVRVEFRIPSVQKPQVALQGAFNLSGFQSVNGVLYPYQILDFRQGKQIGSVTLQSVNINPSIPPSDFDPPAGSAQ